MMAASRHKTGPLVVAPIGFAIGDKMSMAVQKKKEVNLLIQEGFEHTTLGRVLNWLLSAGRVIVVLTELIVIGAFLSRFWLDRTLTDLNESNELKTAQVEASSKFENDFRDVQKRLSLYNQIDTVKTGSAKIVEGVASLLPASVAMTNISLAENELVFDGIALSEGGLAGFVKAIENSEDFGSATLSQVYIEPGGQQVINFTITTSLPNSEEEKN